jgi:hypothetical protein
MKSFLTFRLLQAKNKMMRISNFQALSWIKKAMIAVAHNINCCKTLMAQERDATKQRRMRADLNDQMFTPRKISRWKIRLQGKDSMPTMELKEDSVSFKEYQIKRESLLLIQSFFENSFPFPSKSCILT